MSTFTIDAHGHLALDGDLLKHLGVGPGDKIAVERLPGGCIEIKAARPTGRISDAFGILKCENGPSLSIEEMNEVIAAAWAGESHR